MLDFTSMRAQAQWVAVAGANPSRDLCDECPVGNVTWEDAVDFANQMSTLEGFTAVYSVDSEGTYTFDRSADGYRLPTEAEWEYTARCGEDTLFPGADDADRVAWYAEGTIMPVAQLAPNACGLYDMAGNSIEWVWDWYEPDYYSESPSVDPLGPLSPPDVPRRVHRSGSVELPWEGVRLAERNSGAIPSEPQHILSLRLVRTVHTDEDGDGVVTLVDCDDTDPDIGENCPPSVTDVANAKVHLH